MLSVKIRFNSATVYTYLKTISPPIECLQVEFMSYKKLSMFKYYDLV